MSEYPKLTNYVSGMDLFLQQFDREHPGLSLSQEKEIAKYRLIYYLRDVAERRESRIKKIWEGF